MTTTTENFSPLAEARLAWKPAEVAIYYREDGIHATYIAWQTADGATELLDLRSGTIDIYPSLDDAKQAAALEEKHRGRPELIDIPTTERQPK